MIGYPTENKETIKESVELCKELGLTVKFNFVCPYPGTEIFSMKETQEKIFDLEDFMKRIGDGRDYVINLTNFEEEELFRLREKAEKEIEKAYSKKHWMLAIIFSPVKLFKKNLAETIKLYQLGQLGFATKSYAKMLLQKKNKKTEKMIMNKSFLISVLLMREEDGDEC